MEENYENLVIKGGGNTVFGVFGALKVLEKKGILKNMKRMAGSSAGSGIVGLLAVGYKPKELIKIISEMNFSKFLDGSTLSYLGYVYRLYNYGGFFHGSDMYRWFGAALELKTGDPDITFKEVQDRYGVELIITGTCVNKRETHYYRPISNPNMPIRAAVRISCSIPFVFKPIRWNGDWLTDGGLTNNYPIWIFDKEAEEYNSKKGKVIRDRTIKLNPKTLGISVLNKDDQETYALFEGNDNINGNIDYTIAIISTILTQQNRVDIDREFWPQTLSVRCNKNITQSVNFNTSKDEKIIMIKDGIKSARKFIKNKEVFEEACRLAKLI